MGGLWPPELVTALTPLIGLLEDDAVTEIAVNAPSEVWTKGSRWRGWRRESGACWEDHDEFLVACTRISDVIGRSVNRERPLLNARLPGGERVNIAIPPACGKIALTIRKFPSETMTLDRLEELGSLALRPSDNEDLFSDNDPTVVSIPARSRPTTSLRPLCEALVLARASIVIAGGTNSGKTSLLNALSRVIPTYERVVTIEDARELQIQQPNWVALETVESIDGKTEGVTIQDLVRNSLRMTPDRIIVG
ncbi:MAG TPA: ATPase, T2SS/T4P/T4SS family, partial [Polyangia bacterium]